MAREAAEKERCRREAQRQKVQEWMEARQARRLTVNIPVLIIGRNTYHAQVSPYIMMRAHIMSLTKYRYRVFRRMKRGP